MQPLLNIILFEKMGGYLIILLCKLYVSISVDITTKDPPFFLGSAKPSPTGKILVSVGEADWLKWMVKTVDIEEADDSRLRPKVTLSQG